MPREEDPLIVIVAFHNTRDLEAVLGAIGQSHPVLVVDNGVDEEVRTLVERHAGRYITPGTNVGFAAAVNLAVAEREDRDVLLVNPDARLSSEVPAALRDALHSASRTAAVAPRLRTPDARPESVEWPIPSPLNAWVEALGLGRWFRPRDTFLIGAVLLLRSEALDDVGYFDERFFLYAEETDWQLRALRRGWKLKVVDDVTAEHWGGRSSEVDSLRNDYFRRSARAFGVKWYGLRGWRIMQAAEVTGTLLRLAYSVFRPERRAMYAGRLRQIRNGWNG